MASQKQNEKEGPTIRNSFHGFFNTSGDEELDDMRECTIYITDTELVLGDQGEYEVKGGMFDVLPDPVEGIAEKIFSEDSGETIPYEDALKRSKTKQLELDEIEKIQIEKSMPPKSKHMVELDKEGTFASELNIFIGTATSYGDGDETRTFVDALEAATHDAGGAPIVETEFD